MSKADRPRLRAALYHAAMASKWTMVLAWPAVAVESAMRGSWALFVLAAALSIFNACAYVNNRIAARAIQRSVEKIQARMTHAMDQWQAEMRDQGDERFR